MLGRAVNVIISSRARTLCYAHYNNNSIRFIIQKKKKKMEKDTKRVFRRDLARRPLRQNYAEEIYLPADLGSWKMNFLCIVQTD